MSAAALKKEQPKKVVSLRQHNLKKLHNDMKEIVARAQGVCTDSTFRKLSEIREKLFLETVQLENLENEE